MTCAHLCDSIISFGQNLGWGHNLPNRRSGIPINCLIREEVKKIPRKSQSSWVSSRQKALYDLEYPFGQPIIIDLQCGSIRTHSHDVKAFFLVAA